MKVDSESKNCAKKRSQSGQSLVEYLVIVALVGIGGIGIMGTVGKSIEVSFGRVSKALGADVEGKIENARVTQNQTQRRSLRNFMSDAKNKSNGDLTNSTDDESNP
jgi:Flp pilus assembly pilin Flp